MKKIFTIFFLLLFIHSSHAQDIHLYNQKYRKLTKSSMLVLGGWGSINLISGVVGNAYTAGSAKYFHQMNAGWNTVNTGLAAGGIFQLKKHNDDESLSLLLKNQYKTEKILLFNTALDFSYIGTGLFLNYRSNFLSEEAQFRNKGFGNSLIMQGAFLLVFDATIYLLHRKNRLKNLEPVLLKSLN
jgi:hypothetical protein